MQRQSSDVPLESMQSDVNIGWVQVRVEITHSHSSFRPLLFFDPLERLTVALWV